MARPKSNVIGLRRHHLTIIEELPNKVMPAGHSRRVVVVRCDCGTVKQIFLNNFNNDTRACGKCRWPEKPCNNEPKVKTPKIKEKRKSRIFPQVWQIVGDTAFIDVVGGRAIIDASDVAIVGQYRWVRSKSASFGVYLNANVAGVRVGMHRLIAGNPEGLEVDHIDGNPLNNTRRNLRICTRAENARNRKIAKHNKSGFKGVYLDKRRNKWVAQLVANRKKINLGYFAEAVDAAKAYDESAKIHFGEFARLNF